MGGKDKRGMVEKGKRGAVVGKINEVGSCGSGRGAEQLTFIYGEVADRGHVR